MNRTITVKGTGTASAKVDYIVIGFRLEAIDRDYETALCRASEQIDAVNERLQAIGFSKGDLKTERFNVETRRDSIRDKNGNYRSVFKGYVCVHHMHLSFDYDMKRLAEALSAIAKTATDPELSIAFTVKDPNTINEAVLRDAAINARARAEVLCAASGVRLGELMSVDYSWGELNVYSHTRYDMDQCCMSEAAPKAAFTADIDPEDVKVTDSVTFVWKID